jgi:hypothetical protein
MGTGWGEYATISVSPGQIDISVDKIACLDVETENESPIYSGIGTIFPFRSP